MRNLFDEDYVERHYWTSLFYIKAQNLKGDTKYSKDVIFHYSTKMDIGEVMKHVLLRAQDEERLTCGLYESGLILEMNPDCVMLCILPVNKTDDIALDIHYTLIEAFCLENDISLLKVDGVDKMKKLLGDHPRGHSTNKVDLDCNDNYCMPELELDDTTDYNCILIEYSDEKCTSDEADILQYYKDTCNLSPEPVIELDV
ncbi:hypothetical protein LSH36_16g13071 [Paralvinella palmiformis]|uniref:Ribosomal protein L7Ae/L30e/S12e/Gadd45 domain-containing protein n=1 Tax=Paralvinella palmiformis TaxID=53620 RepID=A0AAD9KBZ4_9ANNE|nr:hypothetical protein LSH36_16g13071 [Paralvinella palmiformis]